MEKIETDPTLATGYSEKSPTESCLMTLDMYDWNQRTLRALTQIFFQALVSTFSPFPSIWAIPGDLHEPMQQALFLHLVFYIVTFFILFLHWLTRSQSLSHVWLFADPMDCSSPGFPVHHQLWELAQTHVHWVHGAIQPSHPLCMKYLSLRLLPSIFPSIRVFSIESILPIR